jgi:hypothetical protein
VLGAKTTFTRLDGADLGRARLDTTPHGIR